MQVLREMPTNSLEVLGRGRVQQQPSTQADRLIASVRLDELKPNRNRRQVLADFPGRDPLARAIGPGAP
jgi:hypothetical protein